MKDNHLAKEYKTPLFHLVRQDEQNTVFFTASGEGGKDTITNVGITSMTSSTSTEW